MSLVGGNLAWTVTEFSAVGIAPSSSAIDARKWTYSNTENGYVTHISIAVGTEKLEKIYWSLKYQKN